MRMIGNVEISGQRIGYARVSTDKQTTEQQVEALTRAGCETVFVDNGVQATAKDRPTLRQARAAMREGDVFVVWAIDRAFRSTIDAISFLDALMQEGMEFQSLTQQIDTRTPEGRKWFIDTASWAEYERAIISRRTKEKMAYAKAQGQHMGRPFKLSRLHLLNAHQLLNTEKRPIDEVAAKYDVSPITLVRGFQRYGLEAA